MRRFFSLAFLSLLTSVGCAPDVQWAMLPGPSLVQDGAEIQCAAGVIDTCTYAERADVFVIGEIVDVQPAEVLSWADERWDDVDDLSVCSSVQAGLYLNVVVGQSSTPDLVEGDTMVVTFGASQSWRWEHRPHVLDGELDWGTSFDILAPATTVGIAGIRAEDGTYVGVVGGLFVERDGQVGFDHDGKCQALPTPEGTAAEFVAELAACQANGASYVGTAPEALSPEWRDASVCMLQVDE